MKIQIWTKSCENVPLWAVEAGAEKFDARSCCLLVALLLLLEPDNASIPSGHRLTNGACLDQKIIIHVEIDV